MKPAVQEPSASALEAEEEAGASTSDADERPKCAWGGRNTKLIAVGVALLLAIVVVVPIVTVKVLQNNCDSADVTAFLARIGVSEEDTRLLLDDSTSSPQGRALAWMTATEGINICSSKAAQQYALVTLYYSQWEHHRAENTTTMDDSDNSSSVFTIILDPPYANRFVEFCVAMSVVFRTKVSRVSSLKRPT